MSVVRIFLMLLIISFKRRKITLWTLQSKSLQLKVASHYHMSFTGFLKKIYLHEIFDNIYLIFTKPYRFMHRSLHDNESKIVILLKHTVKTVTIGRRSRDRAIQNRYFVINVFFKICFWPMPWFLLFNTQTFYITYMYVSRLYTKQHFPANILYTQEGFEPEA
jgi:hypothetical protein